MALSKTGYKAAIRGTTKAKVGLNSDGNIAQSGETIAKTTNFTIKQVNAENALTDNTDVLNLFIGFAGGTADSLTNNMTVTWEV